MYIQSARVPVILEKPYLGNTPIPRSTQYNNVM